MENKKVRTVIRKNESSGSTMLPVGAYFGEPFVNLYEGKLLFCGATQGIYLSAPGQPTVFEVGSNLSNSFIQNLSANTITSGGTNLYDIFQTIGSVHIYSGDILC